MKAFITTILCALLLTANAQFPLWVNTYNGSGDFSDEGSCLAIDNAGNVFVGGTTMTSGNRDFLVLKLTATGDTLWSRVFNGTGNSEDGVADIKTDASGNVYATGFLNSSVSDDLFTVKIDGNGSIIWQAIYNNASANQDEAAASLALDGSGNVYVVGYSYADANGLNSDAVMLKYNSSGVQQWIKRYDGLGNGYDDSKKVLIDGSGDIYWLVRTDNGSDDDMLTFKYNSSGSLLWTNSVDYGKNDKPTDMTLFGSYVYVSGRSKATNYNLFVRKINISTGATVWSKTYNNIDDDRASNVAVDAAENVYLAGQTDKNANTAIYDYDLIVQKYNSSGTLMWSYQYNNPANKDEDAQSLAIDNSGNVFVAGNVFISNTDIDYLLIKLDNSGANQYTKFFSGFGNAPDQLNQMILTSVGDPIITGGGFPNNNLMDATTIKYSSAGNLSWLNTYSNVGDNNDAGNALIVDASENVYVAGYSVENNSDKNFLVQKIDNTGNTAWTNTISGSSGVSGDEATDVAIDNSGNVIACGYVKDSAVSYNYLTVKYSATGVESWRVNYGDTVALGSDKAVAVDVDAAGNSYVTGRSDVDATDNTNYNILTFKYSATGAVLWSATFEGVSSQNDEAVDIKAAPSGNVYVLGRTYNGTNDDIVLIKYNNTGTAQWTKIYVGTSGDDKSEKMILDASENIYICGRTVASNGKYDALLLKYDASGSLQYAKTFDGGANEEDRWNAITYSDNNVFLVGNTYSSPTNADAVIASYSLSGNLNWTKKHSTAGLDYGKAIIADATGNLSVALQSDSSGNENIITQIYASDGSLVNRFDFDGSASKNDRPSDIQMISSNSSGNFDLRIFITGKTESNTQFDELNIKYGQLVSGISTVSVANISMFPNPFHTFSKIDLHDFDADYKNMQVILFDYLGNKIMTKQVETNEVVIENNQYLSGVYFLELTNGKKTIGRTKVVIE